MTINGEEIVDLQGFIDRWEKDIERQFKEHVQAHVSKQHYESIQKIRDIADQIEYKCVADNLIVKDDYFYD